MKYKTKQSVIDAAQNAGSTAKTYTGAKKYIMANTASVFDEPKPDLWYRQTTQEQWIAKDHERRLLARYVGMKRLPRYLSAENRLLILQHPANREMKRLQEKPVYVRAHYVNYCSDFPRMQKFVRVAEKNRGELVEMDEIEKHSYSVCDFGRKKRTHCGDSCLSPGMRTESYDRGQNPWGGKWTHYDYYADYTLISPVNHGNNYSMYYVDADHNRHTVYVTQNYIKIGKEEPQRRRIATPKTAKFPVHIQRRILSAHVPGILSVDYDREEKSLMLVDGFGEQYHLPEIQTVKYAKNCVKNAIAAFRKRRAEKVKIDMPEKIWVSVEDSYDAGNCHTETNRFAAEVMKKIGADGHVCVRADVILAIRNDNYTRRAVSYAATRN